MADTVLVDANVILRFFQGEPPEQAAAAEWLLAQAGQGAWRVVVHPLVIAEVLYVATSPHGLGLPRAQAVRDLRDLIQLPGIDVPERVHMLEALRRFETTHLDWVDCVLLSYAHDQPVYTFDREMWRHGARRPDPGT